MLQRDELWHGNRESFRRAFLSKESILAWAAATTYRGRRAEFARIRAGGAYPNLAWIELKRQREADTLLRAATDAGTIVSRFDNPAAPR